MSHVLVAPTEPLALKGLGEVSLAPENFGVDFMWVAQGVLHGAQRKEVGDLVNSVLSDDRLYREVKQMKGLASATLIVEGKWSWNELDESRVIKWTRWTRGQFWSLMQSVMGEGVAFRHSIDLEDTAWHIRNLIEYSERDHSSLARRPGPGGPWGSATNRDWSLHFLMGLAGVGPAMAERILDHFGGLPMAWTITAEDLMGVKGIGKLTATKLIRALDGAQVA